MTPAELDAIEAKCRTHNGAYIDVTPSLLLTLTAEVRRLQAILQAVAEHTGMERIARAARDGMTLQEIEARL